MTQQEIEHKRDEIVNILWSAANALRGTMDSSVFMNYILGSLTYYVLSKKIEHKILELIKKDNISIDETFKYQLIFKPIIGYWISPKNWFSNIIKKIDSKEINWVGSWKEGMNEIQENSELKGLFSAIDLDTSMLGTTNAERQIKLSRLLKIINQLNIDITHIDNIEILGDAYEYLLSKFASGSGKKGGEFFTPKEVSQILANIVTHYKPNANDIYDFACGSGSLLLRTAKLIKKNTNNFPEIYGQELSNTTWNLARQNMLLHEVKPNLFHLTNGNTIETDSFDKFDNVKHDIVVANPPFNQKAEDRGETLTSINQQDERWYWTGNEIPRSSLNMGFILTGLYTLHRDGIFACIMSLGVLTSSGKEGDIRSKIINRNWVDAVIELPKNLFSNASVPACIIIFRKNRKENDKVLFVNASEFKTFKAGPKQVLEQESINKVSDIVNHHEEIKEVSKLISMNDIKKNDYSLSVNKYVIKKINYKNIDIKEKEIELENELNAFIKEKKEWDEMKKNLVFTNVRSEENE